MVFQTAFIAALLSGLGAAEGHNLPVTQSMITGTWECGPTTMKGPQFVMTVVDVTNRTVDGTFVSTTTSVITPTGQSAITLVDSASGTWHLDGTLLSSTFRESKFVSSSDPTISAEFGQKIQDDQLRKKSIYKSQVLDISATTMRVIPVDSEYAEAVVESTCQRT